MHGRNGMKRWLPLVILLCASTAWAQDSPAPTAAPPTARELRQLIAEHRRAGEFGRALEVARTTLERELDDEDLPLFRRLDLERDVATLEVLAGLAPPAQAALANVETLTRDIFSALRESRADDAVRLATQQLEVREKHIPGVHMDVATSQTYLAMALRRVGRLEEAETLSRTVVSAMVELQGRESAGTATALNNLAGVLRSRGDLLGAEAAFRESLAIRTQVLGPNHVSLAGSYNNLAAVFLQQGDATAAEDMYQSALSLVEAVRGENHDDTAKALENLSISLREQGRISEAHAALERARAAYESIEGDRQAQLARLDHRRALLLMEDARADEGATLLDDVRRRREQLQSGPAALASTTLELGRAQLMLGRFAQALENFQAASAIYERIYGQAHASTVNCARLIAATLAHTGNPAQAEAVLTQAADNYEQARIRGGTRLARATQQLDSPYDLMAALCLSRQAPEEAWRFSERARARMLSELLRATDQRGLDPEQENRERQLLRELTRLEGESAALGESNADSTAAQRTQIREQLLRAESNWSRLQLEFASQQKATMPIDLDLAEVQATLRPDEGLVGWLDVDDEGGSHGRWGYVLRPDRSIRWVPLAARGNEPEEELRLRLRGEYATPLGLPLNDEVNELCTQVFARNLAPLANSLAGIDHLIVVASGPVLGIPIEVLIDAQDRTALDLVPVSYAPSAGLLRWLRSRPPIPANSANALLLGDPPFSADHLRDMEMDQSAASSGDRGRGVGYLRRLAYTRQEVNAAAATFGNPQVLLGAEASEARVDALARSDRLRTFGTLHLATHAIADPRRPENASLVMAQTGLVEPGEALARNERVYDGVITAREIMATWQLDADLVTLSACNTGLGRRVAGEGYVGLAHALFRAGARSVVMSLWSVDDEATALLMARFYENRASGQDKTHALTNAKRWLRTNHKRYEHPHFWGAFVLMGDDR